MLFTRTWPAAAAHPRVTVPLPVTLLVTCGLTQRESEVLALLCEGLDTREIAERMVVSEHTASDHLKAILAKTGARTRQLLLARGLGTR